MPAFNYRAVDAEGRTRRGSMEGDSPRLIRSRLREQGMTPLQVDAAAASGDGIGALFAPRINDRDRALLTRQLATMLHAGQPLVTALDAAARQTHRSGVRRVLQSVRARVTEGASLAEALGSHPRDFDELYRAGVRAGEASGRLDTVLGSLAGYLESRGRTRRKTQLALLYPALLTIVSLLVVAVLMNKVVPEILSVFNDTNQVLPPLTLGLIAVSDFLRDDGIWLGVGLGLLLMGYHAAMTSEPARRTRDLVLLRLPLLGGFLRHSAAARVTRTLSTLAAAGVPLLEALNIATGTLGNRPLKESLERASGQVREGVPLALALQDVGIFPPVTLNLIASGESGGELPAMLEAAAQDQEQNLETATELFVGIFEPAMILIMGGLVLVIVMAVMLPLFEMNQLVS